MDRPRRAARDRRVRKDVARIVAQKRRALSAPLRFLLYTHIRRTSERSPWTSDRSMSFQLPFDSWFTISARSPAVQPARSSRNACLRVFGSGWATERAKAHPVFRVQTLGLSEPERRKVKSAAGLRLRRE
eukprot:5598009-Pleurochrysis_carterae.AAC.1